MSTARNVTVAGMTLVRAAPGVYRTPDDEWTITQGERGCSWSGMWVFANSTMRGANQTVSDPVWTLREAVEQMRASIEAAR